MHLQTPPPGSGYSSSGNGKPQASESDPASWVRIGIDSAASTWQPLMTLMNSPEVFWKDKRAIVTGGAGFIGSAIAWELNRRGCSQIVIADFQPETEKRANLAGLQ